MGYKVFLGWLLYTPYDVVSANPFLLCYWNYFHHHFASWNEEDTKIIFPDSYDFTILPLPDLKPKPLTRETDKEKIIVFP